MTKSVSKEASFAARIVAWQAQHGRHDLPWQSTRDPYRIWLSEIMLQQTQVSAVIPYYARFLNRFPTIHDVADASVSDVLAQWSGLGYYARGRNVHRCAQIVVNDHGGAFPRSAAALAELPGIGRSTANAIAAFAFGESNPILDGNVKRVFARHAGVVGYPGAPAVARVLWDVAQARMPPRTRSAQHALALARYTQGLMDLGAMICTRTRPRCEACPVAADCVARQTQRVAQLPTPRPKKTLPLRSVRAAVVRNRRGDVLVAQRPSEGIWGGLLSLPELSDPTSESPLIPAAQKSPIYPEIFFNFTHFRLQIQPIAVRVQAGFRARAPLQWLSLANIERAALPAPIKRFLTTLREADG